jgi:phytoene dehydrogenase-like protein
MSTTAAYDGVIIGSGQHGLILGAYLARAGLKIAVVENRLYPGGGLSTEERTLPGFYHNLHSINHFSVTSAPWFKDLGLAGNVDYITPRYEFAQPHADGSALIFSRDIDETAASIARFSVRDARTFREWNARAEEMTRLVFMVERYAEPLDEERRAAALDKSAVGRDFYALTKRQPIDVVNDLFENERVKVLFLFKLSLFGTVLHETLGTSSPLGSVIRAFDLQSGYQLCSGGSWNLARGLYEAFIAAGGTFINQAKVARIAVDGGRATGVELTDGRVVRAGQFVASTADVHQTFDEMVGREQFPAAFREKIENFQYTKWTLFGLHLALNEAPKYTASAFDPNLQHALKYNLGSETVASLLDAHTDVVEKRLPKNIQFGGGALSVLDPRQAPPGKHTAYAWHVVPYDIGGDPDEIRNHKTAFGDAILEKWATYAPNMTRANILGRYEYTSYEYTREIINMRFGDIMMGELSAQQVHSNHFGYRTPIANLYMAGSATHPNGGISGGCGYISANVIAKDLGIVPWWQPVDAERDLPVEVG